MSFQIYLDSIIDLSNETITVMHLSIGQFRIYLLINQLLTLLSNLNAHRTVIIICPIAIAYSMGQIIKSVCVCQCICVSVCLSVCEHSHGRIS